MADDHDHSHDSNYADQLFALGVCGLIGGLAIILWYQSRLGDLLNSSFHIWVLLTGAILCGIVLIRGVAVWFSVKLAVAHAHTHDHDHDHAHDHTHEHGHDHAHDHSHDHGHDHAHDHGHDHSHAPAANGDGHDHGGWAPWRYIVLLLVAGGSLFVLWIPPGALPAATQVYFAKQEGRKVPELEHSDKEEHKGEWNATFLQLEQAAMDKDAMDEHNGNTIHISGRYVGDDPRRFRLVRYKMTCCMADAIPLNAVIMLDKESDATLDFNNLRYKWVEVTGRVQFLHPPGSNVFVPAVILTPTKEKPLSELVKVVPPDPNPYAN